MTSRLTLAVACAGFFMVVLDTTVVNVALPAIDTSLGGGVAGSQWVVDAYTLTFGALVLSAGHVSDRIGASVGFGAGITGFAMSSALCALAPTLGVLVVARAFQGASAAVMLPSSLALVSMAHPDSRGRARAISMWATSGAAAVAAGPLVGGILTAHPGWRCVFFINLPIAALALVGLRLIPRSPTRPVRLDVVGQLGGVTALALFTFALVEGGRTGFDQPRVLVGLVLFVAVSATLLGRWRSPHAPLPIPFFKTRAAAGAIGVGLALYFAFYGVIFTLSLYFQHVLHFGPERAGLMFVPMTVLIAASTMISGTWSTRTSPFVPMATGAMVMALGFLALAAVEPGGPVWEVAVATVPIGVGSGIAGPAIPIAILAALPPERNGVASGVANALRQVAATIGVAVFGALLAGHGGLASGMRDACLISSFALIGGVVLALRALPGRIQTV